VEQQDQLALLARPERMEIRVVMVTRDRKEFRDLRENADLLAFLVFQE